MTDNAKKLWETYQKSQNENNTASINNITTPIASADRVNSLWDSYQNRLSSNLTEAENQYLKSVQSKTNPTISDYRPLTEYVLQNPSKLSADQVVSSAAQNGWYEALTTSLAPNALHDQKVDDSWTEQLKQSVWKLQLESAAAEKNGGTLPKGFDVSSLNGKSSSELANMYQMLYGTKPSLLDMRLGEYAKKNKLWGYNANDAGKAVGGVVSAVPAGLESFQKGTTEGIEGLSEIIKNGANYDAKTGKISINSGVSDDLKTALTEEQIQQRQLRNLGQYKYLTDYQNVYKPNVEHLPAANLLSDLTFTYANMAPSVMANYLAPGAGTALLGLSAGGNSYGDALLEGKTKSEALAYGIASGSLEAITQKLLGGIGGFGKSTASKIGGKIASKIPANVFGKVRNVLKKMATSPVGKAFLNNLSESNEELVQANLEPILRNIIFDENNEFKPFSEDKLYAALLGFASAGAMNLPSTVADIATSRQEKAIKKLQGQIGTEQSKSDIARDLLNGLGVSEDTTLMQYGQSIYDVAQQNPGESAQVPSTTDQQSTNDGAKFSLQTDANGNQYVNVDTDQNIFEGADPKEYSKIANQYILKHFRGKVIGDTNRAYVNKRSAEEFAHPANRRLEQNIRNSKMKSSTELDNLMSASRFIEHTSDDGRHPDATGGWDWYSVDFIVDGQAFNGTISVKNTDHGRIFHDMTKIKSLTDRKGDLSGESLHVASVDKTSSDPIVPQDTAGVNTSISNGAVNNAGNRQIRVAESELKLMEAIAKKGKIPFEIRNLGVDKQGKPIEGKYENGKIYVSPYAERPSLVIFKHELTHHLENDSYRYKELLEVVKEFYAKNGQKLGTDFAAEIRKKQDLYRAKGQNINGDEAVREVVADFVGEYLFTDETAIQYLADRKPHLARKIVNWIREQIAAIKGDAETELLLKAERIYVKALKNADKLAGIEGKAKYSYAGENAKTANLSALQEAIENENWGMLAEQNRRQTGWFRGKDGKWRFEIDDSAMEFNKNGFVDNPVVLSDYVKHDALFAAYPELANVKIEFSPSLNVNGKYSYGDNGIMLKSGRSNADTKATLIHEIQHAIQYIEGFATGGTLRSGQILALNEAYRYAKTLSQYQQLKTPDERLQYLLNLIQNKSRDGNITSVYKEYYRQIHGEIEARDVAERLKLDKQTRRTTPPANRGIVKSLGEMAQEVVDNLLEMGYTESKAERIINQLQGRENNDQSGSVETVGRRSERRILSGNSLASGRSDSVVGDGRRTSGENGRGIRWTFENTGQNDGRRETQEGRVGEKQPARINKTEALSSDRATDTEDSAFSSAKNVQYRKKAPPLKPMPIDLKRNSVYPTRSEIAELEQLAKIHRINFEIDPNMPWNISGLYVPNENKIKINKYAFFPAMEVYKHELTHHIEKSKYYDDLLDVIKKYYRSQNIDFKDVLERKRSEYSGISHNTEHEVIAEFCGRYLFNHDSSIKRLAEEKPNLAKQILYWIQDMISYFKGEKPKILIEAERKYLRALRDTVKHNSSVKADNDIPKVQFSLSDDYDGLVEQYGAIPTGENPARDVSVPKQTNDNTKVRRTVRTVMEAKGTPEQFVEQLKADIVDGVYNYEVISDKEAVSHAKERLEKWGLSSCFRDWQDKVASRKRISKFDYALAEQIYIEAAENGDFTTAEQIAVDMAMIATEAGQLIQANRLLKNLTPDGRLYKAEKVIKALQKELDARFKGKSPTITISEELKGRLKDAKSIEEMEALEDMVLRDVADQLPAADPARKWNEWRYLAMLGNFKTHIRNFSGNLLFMPAVKTKNAIGMVMEQFIAKENRTKALLTPKDKALRQFAKDDFAAMQDVVSGEGKKKTGAQAIEQYRRVYKTRWLEGLRKFNQNCLQREDGFALKRHYVSSLAQFIKARGWDYKNLSPEQLDAARQYAVSEAQKATYRDASALADHLNRISRSHKLAEVALGGNMPFTKTPINILKRGIEYSPIGIGKGLIELAVDLKKGKSAAEAINSLSAGLTGTGVMLLGVFLSAAGILKSTADDEDEKTLERLAGGQEYSLEIGGVSLTIDWIAPMSMPLFVGAEIQKIIEAATTGSDYSVGQLLDALGSISEPMFNLSMLQGLSDAIKAGAYDKNPLLNIASGTIANYVTQGIPTLSGQIARTTDMARRNSYYSEQESKMGKMLDKTLQKTMAKVPGVSYLLQPYVDQWGETEVKENAGDFFMSALENLFFPFYTSVKKDDPVTNEIAKIYARSSEGGVIPRSTPTSLSIDSVKYIFTNEEYTNYQKTLGATSHDVVEDFIKTSEYADMTDSERADAISWLYTYANEKAKAEFCAGRGISFDKTPNIKKMKLLKENGLSIEQYLYVYNKVKDIEGRKNARGETISGSVKRNKINYMVNELGISRPVANKIYQLL